MQMGVEERQGIACGPYPTAPASHALHMHEKSSGAKDNLVVEETTTCCGYSQASNPMTTLHSEMDTAEATGEHCGRSVGDLKLGTDRVSA